jgi:hypothetical protein
MGILFGFAPFIVFAVLDHFFGAVWALPAGAATSAALLARDLTHDDRYPKLLEVGTFILFSALALIMLMAGPALSVIAVRLCVDTGLLAIVLVSMVVGRPFTLQYARESVPAELWNTPRFVRTNFVITGAWAVALAVIVMTEAAMVYVPSMPHQAGILLIVLAMVGAVEFTGWYPKRVRMATAR